MSKVILKASFIDGAKGSATGLLESVLDYNATRDGADLSDIETINLDNEYLDNTFQYNATREGVDLIDEDSHGLFNQNGKCDLNFEKQQANQCYQNGSIFFKQIISLYDEDAELKNLKSATEWNKALNVIMPKVASQYDISLDNFVWNGAYHTNTDNPHVHVVFYSKDPNEGRHSLNQSKDILEKNKSILVNHIFKEEMNELKLLKESSKLDIKSGLNATMFADEFKSLNEILPKHGKTNYQFLPKEVKVEVDKLFEKIIKNDIEISKSISNYLNSQVNMKLMYENLSEDDEIKYREDLVSKLISPSKKDFNGFHNSIIKTAKNIDLAKHLDNSSSVNFETKVVPATEIKINEQLIVSDGINNIRSISSLVANATKEKQHDQQNEMRKIKSRRKDNHHR